MTTIKERFAKFRIWCSSNSVGVLLLTLQVAGLAGMLYHRDDIEMTFWIWGVVVMTAGLGLVGLRNRTPGKLFDWILFGSGFFMAAVSAYLMWRARS